MDGLYNIKKLRQKNCTHCKSAAIFLVISLLITDAEIKNCGEYIDSCDDQHRVETSGLVLAYTPK